MVLCRWDDLPEHMRCQAVRPYYEVLERRQGMLLLKFIFDRAMALLLLVLLSPVFLLVAAWIRLDSPGEVFFRQERVPDMAGGSASTSSARWLKMPRALAPR